ncbi:hypothetical protein SAMN05421769_0268 [Chryseobacterium scophthalmum]|uniref:Uncharacterized protein n=3 Tax=Chryseobacterium scophthalmum TaxID=59733 RepID=A0A1N6EF11_9FLAO|nr:hypothetical protein SAMN05421769_0268 [Chryseobacterium scophthalmum]
MMNTKDLMRKKKARMKCISTVLMIMSLLTLQSCEDVVDQIYENKQEQNAVSPYRGTYTGTYTGDVNGNLIINVSEKGTIEITRNTLNSSESYLTGFINASFNTTNRAPSGFMLIGNLNSKMGTWEMGSLKGNWTVKKN